MSDVQSESLDAPPATASPPSGASVPVVPADQAPITLSETRGPSGKAPAPAHSHTPTRSWFPHICPFCLSDFLLQLLLPLALGPPSQPIGPKKVPVIALPPRTNWLRLCPL